MQEEAEVGAQAEGARRRIPRKRKEGPKIEKVEVEVPEIPEQATPAIAQALIKHLLFMRQQIPMPLEQFKPFLRSEAPENPRKRPSPAHRKALKVLDAMEGVLQGVEDLCREMRLLGILITLGSTPINPKEAFILRFPEDCPPSTFSAADLKKKTGVLSRTLIRLLVTSGLSNFDKPAFPLKTYVLALAVPKGPRTSGDENSSR
mmetsp:Transcript_3597/g.5718  ORF Transcript_3597/g.5718 Transcript_3597/m.5718 type:complete len:204 (+) Transcript_3597:426-1037(+)